MRMIHKYPVLPGSTDHIKTYAGAKFVHFAEARDGQLYVWVEFNPNALEENLNYRIFGTGHPIEPPVDLCVEHRFSCQQSGGTFVWHLYEVLLR